MLFLFDYGDEQHFHVAFNGIERAKPGVKSQVVVKFYGYTRPQYETFENDDDGYGNEDEDV